MQINPEFLDPNNDREFINYLKNLDPPNEFDDLDDWMDNVNLFMESLLHPDKIDELWHISKAKRMWEESQNYKQHEQQCHSQPSTHQTQRVTVQMENAPAHVAPPAQMGFSPPEPTYNSKNIPFGLKNSASIYQEATSSKTLTKLEKGSVSPIGYDQISDNSGTTATDQKKPSEGRIPNNPSPTIKPNKDWPNSGEEELPYQDGPALPSPQ